MKKKCCVFGGSGFIGRHLVHTLSKDLSRSVFSINRNLVETKDKLLNVDYVKGDIGDEFFLREILKDAHEVIDLVYATNPKTSFDNPLEDIVLNLPANVNLLRLTSCFPSIRYLMVSSGGTVYGNAIELPIKEDHPTNPISPYGITKLALEKYALMYRALSGLDLIIVRPGNPYGSSQSSNHGQGFIAAATEAFRHSKQLYVYGKKGTVRDYIYIDDLVEGVISALNYGVSGEIYNIGTGVGLNNMDVIEIISKIFDRVGKANIVNLDPRPFDVPSNILCSEKLFQVSGWRSKISIINGIELSSSQMIFTA